MQCNFLHAGGLGGLVLAIFHKYEIKLTDKIHKAGKEPHYNYIGWYQRKNVKVWKKCTPASISYATEGRVKVLV